MKNQFLDAISASPNIALTQNGAVSQRTTGAAVLDYFAKAATYRDRTYPVVSQDLNAAWNDSPLLTLMVIFYNRMITRREQGSIKTEKVQKGQGNRSEYRRALEWLLRNHPEQFYKNLNLCPVVGAWKDLWHIEMLNLPTLEVEAVYQLIANGLKNAYDRQLISKYLPKIRSRRNTFNDRHRALNNFAYGFCKFMGWSPRDYRRFKAAGTAHQFQRDMCAKKWQVLDFNTFPGKALTILATSKGKKDQKTTLQRHLIEANYTKWLSNKPVAPFTGYVYELGQLISKSFDTVTEMTVNKQFDGLLALAKKDVKKGALAGKVMCALDTSGSMGIQIGNKGPTALEVCKSLGIYFSSLLEGEFAETVIMYDNTSRFHSMKGLTNFSQKWRSIPDNAMGGTNFQSIIDLLVSTRRNNPNIPLSDYPDTILVVSDMQFNPVNAGYYYRQAKATNPQEARAKLAAVGLNNMKFIWWQVNGGYALDQTELATEPGTTLVSGFDGATISLLLDGEQAKFDPNTRQVRNLNAYENMLKILDQEVLKLVRI